ncbi:retrovirus-related pol polyprotein from transposon TNT 1-94 [Tanacetum coccineum]
MAAAVSQTLEYRGGQLNVAPVLEDFQDSSDDEEDTKSNQEYLNDLKEEYQAKALLAKSKRFFKKGSQRFSGVKATEDTQCHKCGKNGHFARDSFSKTLVPSFSSPFKNEPRLTNSSHQTEQKSKDFEVKYNKDAKEVSSDEEEMAEVKSLMALTEEDKVSLSKEDPRNGKYIQISMEKNNERTLPSESKINTTNPSVVVLDSSASDYDYADKS